jgi:hypothetical protein
MERRIERTTATNLRTVVDAKMSLSLWLRAGRANKGLSLDAVAKITKIQSRILERLEAGKLDGLPAEVFVRGFVRSFARCVGLDEGEALERYSLAAGQPTSPSAAVARAGALVETMSELAPMTATRAPKVLQETVVQAFLPETGTLLVEEAPIAPAPIEPEIIHVAPIATDAPLTVEAAEAVETADAQPTASKKKKRGNRGKKRKSIASGTPSSAMQVVEAAAVESVEQAFAEGSTATMTATAVEAAAAIEVTTAEPVIATTDSIDIEPPTEPWSPKMPAVMPSVPWRRPMGTLSSIASAVVIPSLVIDDADPDSAERELEDRAAAKEPARRSFLPPILLDREDRSARQGGLTLAVIILLIAATLTLSYLMRRPSTTGDGVTSIQTTSQHIA